MRAAMATASASTDGAAIRVLQMHGTGTPLGDPIEVGAACAALCTTGNHPGDRSVGGRLVLEAAKSWAVGPGRCCSPRHRTHFAPPFLESNGIL